MLYLQNMQNLLHFFFLHIIQLNSQQLLLDIKTSAYKETLTEQDSFIAGVIEFALILRDSEYKKDANLSRLVTRLNELELEDEFKAEFRELVKKYQDRAK